MNQRVYEDSALREYNSHPEPCPELVSWVVSGSGYNIDSETILKRAQHKVQNDTCKKKAKYYFLFRRKQCVRQTHT
jgi:hypothetical protein